MTGGKQATKVPNPQGTIDRTTPIPYYYQLEQLLRQEIKTGRWQPGQMILSERQLCELFGVSRTTVRQAIGRLVQGGLLENVKGTGTFVAGAEPPRRGRHSRSS